MSTLRTLFCLLFFSTISLSLASQSLQQKESKGEGGGDILCKDCVVDTLFFLTTAQIPTSILSQISISGIPDEPQITTTIGPISLTNIFSESGCTYYYYSLEAEICGIDVMCEWGNQSGAIGVDVEYTMTLNGNCLVDELSSNFFDGDCLPTVGCPSSTFSYLICCDDYIGGRRLRNDLGEVILSPNPFNNEIFIQNLLRDDEMRIFDAQGRFLMKKECKDFENLYLDTSNFKSGIYIVECRRENKLIQVNKLVKL